MHRRLIKPVWMFAAEAGGEGGEGAGAEGSGGDATEGQEGKAEGFTQADVDRIVKERVQRERAKFADYDDLKKKAEGAKTAEERLAELEQEITATKREALRRRVQAAHGISDEDADLFLTGADEESLTAQAKRLAEHTVQQKKHGNRVPREGASPSSKADGEREAVRNLFGAG